MKMEKVPDPPRITRREFIKLFTLSLGAIGARGFQLDVAANLVEAGKDFDPGNPEIHYHQFALPEGQSEAFAVVQLTDLHAGPVGVSALNINTFPPAIDKLNSYLANLRLPPKNVIVTVTGDFVNQPHTPHKPEDKLLARFRSIEEMSESNLEKTRFAEIVKWITQINAQCFLAVRGNHDTKHTSSEQIKSIIQNAGIHLLDEDPIQFATWPHLPVVFSASPDITHNHEWYAHPGNLEPFADLSDFSDQVRIHLTHNPTALDPKFSPLSQYLKGTLALTGHTHWGSVARTGPTGTLLHEVALHKLGYPSELVGGMYLNYAGNHVYVSGGLGTHPFPPPRTVPAQIAVFHFK